MPPLVDSVRSEPGSTSKQLAVLLNCSLTAAQLELHVKNTAEAKRIKYPDIESIVVDKVNGSSNDTGIENLSPLLSANRFPLLKELDIKVPVSTMAFEDFSSTSRQLRTIQMSSQSLKRFPVFHMQIYKLESLSLVKSEIDNLDDQIFRYFQNMRSLHLNENKLTRIRGDTFSGLHMLQYLNLDKNQIDTMEIRAFAYLDGLQTLILSNNRFKVIEIGIFTDTLENLKCLNFDNNQIDTIRKKAFFFLPKLETVILSNNRLKKIDSIEFPLTFQNFDVSHNPIRSIDIVKLALQFDLKKLNIESTEPRLEKINATAIKNPISQLEYLNMKSCKIMSVDHLKPVGFLFPKLKTIDLAGNPELNNLGIVDMKSLQRKVPNWKTQ